MKEFFLNGPEEYRLMNQTGVRQYVFPNGSHNAIWDSNIDPDGRLYFGLSSEIFTSGYTRFCEYDYEKNDVITHFHAEDVILPGDRTIRASKIHTSIGFLPDRRIIMTTHTTDKSPAHPTWLPYAYYNHLWEGFAGSHIILYDPAAKKAENLGIPVPHESIYGSIYHEKTNTLYFLGFMRGHLYRYSLDTRRVVDMGKASEDYAFRIAQGADGHLYSATRSGWVYKIDTDTNKIIDLNYRFPHEAHSFATHYNNLSVARTGPDGRLYMAVMYGRDIHALDTKTGKIEAVGEYLPAMSYVRGENRSAIFAMDFDSEGVLWYALTSKNDGDNKPEHGLPASLFCWDIARGGKPVWAGLIGTPARVGSWMSELCVTQSDIFYAVSSNHSLDGPDITAVDLKAFRPHLHEMGGGIRDGFLDPENEYYRKTSGILFSHEKIMGANPAAFAAKPKYPPIRLFRALAPEYIDHSGVKRLIWETDSVLYGLCGEAERFAFQIEDGALRWIKPLAQAEPALREKLTAGIPAPRISDKLPLPHYHGRQYKAVPAVTAAFSGGRTAVGTSDGMLALVSGDSVFSLGPTSPNGPVRALTVSPDKTRLYGVSGDESDINSVFSYDDTNGLRWLGIIRHTKNDAVGPVGMNILSCCVLSPDGGQLAIASDERLGTVMIYEAE